MKNNGIQKGKFKWYFLRHGEVESNVKKIYPGWSEELLTQKGRQQVIKVAKKLSQFKINRIYTSPLKRAVQTANIIGDFLKKRPFFEENFKELRLGIWEGMSEDEISRLFPEEWEIWNKKPAELELEGREKLHELLERVLNGVRKIRENEDGGNILVVSHLAAIRILLLYTKKMDMNLYRTISILNGEFIEIPDEQLISN